MQQWTIEEISISNF